MDDDDDLYGVTAPVSLSLVLVCLCVAGPWMGRAEGNVAGVSTHLTLVVTNNILLNIADTDFHLLLLLKLACVSIFYCGPRAGHNIHIKGLFE